MVNSSLVLLAIVITQIGGDYFIKIASARPDGLVSIEFTVGVILYGATALGWYFLMKNHSLAEIGVVYSASTILLLATLGYFVFHENVGPRQFVGLTLAILSVIVMRTSG